MTAKIVFAVLVGGIFGYSCRCHFEPASKDQIYFQPESLVIGPKSIEAKGTAKEFFDREIPTAARISTDRVLGTHLRCIDSRKLFDGQKLQINEPTTPAWLVQASTALGGFAVVWAANEMIVGNAAMNEANDHDSLEISGALLYAALCDPSSREVPAEERTLSSEEEIGLVDAVAFWGIKTLVPSSQLRGAYRLEGNIYCLSAIRVEIASFFNRQLWGKRGTSGSRLDSKDLKPTAKP